MNHPRLPIATTQEGDQVSWPTWLPRDTPWGQADVATIIDNGIAVVSTPSHGGIFVNDTALQSSPSSGSTSFSR